MRSWLLEASAPRPRLWVVLAGSLLPSRRGRGRLRLRCNGRWCRRRRRCSGLRSRVRRNPGSCPLPRSCPIPLRRWVRPRAWSRGSPVLQHRDRHSRSAADFPRTRPRKRRQTEGPPGQIPLRSGSCDSLSLPWVSLLRLEQHAARFPCRQRIGGANDDLDVLDPVCRAIRPPMRPAQAPTRAQLTR